MSFICPVCKHTSYNPNDERAGYCGYCHAFTGVPQYEYYGRFPDGELRPRSSRDQAGQDRPVQLPQDNKKPKAE